MSFEDTVKGIANREFQNKTGTPPEMLRGLIGSANAELQNFAARRLAITPQVDKPDTKVTSDITRLGGGTPPSLGEAASSIGTGGDAPQIGTDDVELTISGASYTGTVFIDNLVAV